MIHPDQPFTGRALTAAYLPGRPDLAARIMKTGKEEGRIGPSNSWPIDMLQKGDVYIADGFGKVADGTLIGDNLGNAIFAKTGTGVVFDAGARDLDGLKQIEGFNACVRGWDPSFLQNVVLSSINRPIRIGPVTVLPGDVILARREGVIVIPAHLTEEVVVTAEIVALKDEFGHLRLKEGVYTPGQIDVPWTPPIKADFFKWLESRPNKPPIPPERDREATVMRRAMATVGQQVLFAGQDRADPLARRSRRRRAPSSRRRWKADASRSSRGAPRCSGVPSRSCLTISATLTPRFLVVPGHAEGAAPRWRSRARTPRS